MEFKKVNITLPEQLFDKSKELVEKGLYSNFSDLVRSSLRKELKDEHSYLKDSGEWQKILEELRAELRKTDLVKMSKRQILSRLRKSRAKIYDEEYN